MGRLLAKWNAKAGVEFTRIHSVDCELDAEHIDRFGVQLWANNRSRNYESSPDSWEGRWVDAPRLSEHPSVIDSIRDIVDNNPRLKSLVWNVGTDPGCVEIPSAPLKSWTKLREFYMKIDTICNEHGYTANDNAVGTGGHIHVEHNEDEFLKAKVVRDMYYRPYVKWAFANPQDTQNCQPHAIGAFPHWKLDTWQKRQYGRCVYDLTVSGSAINLQDETIEFRLFDMTWNWGEQEEHMAYVQAYMSWIKSDSYIVPKPLKHATFEEIPLRTSIHMFKKHIEELGLPWDRYVKYTGYIKGHYQWKTLGRKVHPEALCSMASNIKKYDKKPMLERLAAKKLI